MFFNMQVLYCNYFILYLEVKDKSKQLFEGFIIVNMFVFKYLYICKLLR